MSARPATRSTGHQGQRGGEVAHRGAVAPWCSCLAHACRDDEVVCGRVELTVRADWRLGLTAGERRLFAVRFLDDVESRLRAELTELVRRRGAAARRTAERMEPIEIVFDDPPRGLQRITGWVQPPQQRNGDPQDIQFGLRGLT